MRGIDKSTLAESDLLEHFIYLYDEAGEAVANRFLDNAEKSFVTLTAHSQIGSALTLRSPALAGMRKWAVEGFANYLIFIYRSRLASLLCVCCTTRRTGGSCSAW